MARLIRPLMQWPKLQPYYYYRASLNDILSSLPLPTTATKETAPFCPPLISTAPSSCRNVHHRPRGVRSPNAPTAERREDDRREDDSTSGSDSDEKKSRNQKKREAKRAVRWGMQLAAFSTPQIKRILRVASLEDDVFDAIMLVKRLGPNVREGKRRQFNYIGKLLREAEPELMEVLIQATKIGDHATLQALATSNMQNIEDEDERPDETEDEEDEEDEEDSHDYINLATRWYDGLISKDVKTTNEVYSVHTIDFDRQELRKLVKRVLTVQECLPIANGNKGNGGEKGQADATVVSAKRSLARFLRTIAKKTSVNNI